MQYNSLQFPVQHAIERNFINAIGRRPEKKKKKETSSGPDPIYIQYVLSEHDSEKVLRGPKKKIGQPLWLA